MTSTIWAFQLLKSDLFLSECGQKWKGDIPPLPGRDAPPLPGRDALPLAGRDAWQRSPQLGRDEYAKLLYGDAKRMPPQGRDAYINRPPKGRDAFRRLPPQGRDVPLNAGKDALKERLLRDYRMKLLQQQQDQQKQEPSRDQGTKRFIRDLR